MWTRRRFLALPLGAAAAALLPLADVPRLGEEWIEEAKGLDRRGAEMGPAATAANSAALLHRLDAAIAQAPRSHDRLPLHTAAAIAGAVAARCARWQGISPTSYLHTGMTHAEAAHDGPAESFVLQQQAAAIGEPLRATGLPATEEVQLAARALWAAGASSSSASLRCAVRWRLAWQYAAAGEGHAALREAETAIFEGQRGSWHAYSLQTAYGEVLARCGHHRAAQDHFLRALTAPPVSRIAALTDLAMVDAAAGDADAAACHLEEAVHLAHGCQASGRLGAVRTIRALIPPGPHRSQLDDALRG